jgi:integrase
MATIRRRRDKFEVQVRRAGLPHLSKSFSALKDAQAWARLKEGQADRSELPLDPKTLQRVTLGELVERYRDTVTVEKRTRLREQYALAAFLAHPICSKRLSELRTEDFAAYRDQRLREIKPLSLKRQLAPIHNLFEIAREDWGLPIRENPLDKLRLKAPDQRRERRLKPGELNRILEAARFCRNPLIARIILFALATAMRRGEILAVEGRHIDIDRQALLIPETKNGHPRTIPLTDQAIAVLRSSVTEGRARTFPITANAFRLAWERVKRKAGIDDLHFHDLRHEAISGFFEKGLSTPEVALISGHKDMRMLFRYAHATREQILLKLQARDTSASRRLTTSAPLPSQSSALARR